MTETSTDALAVCAEQNEWLRNLARRLVEDSTTGDDVAQDAALAALQAMPEQRHGAQWLVGVIQNLVANRRRQSARRHRVELAGAVPEAQPSAAESAARIEQQRLLADVVLGLEQPFRDVVVLRFYDDLERREIAQRLNVPIATVNSRLGRAMQKLRERLDAEHDGDRQTWVVALAPLIAPVSGQNTILLGALAMKKKLAAAVAAIILLSTVTWVLVPVIGDTAIEPQGNPVTVVLHEDKEALIPEVDSTTEADRHAIAQTPIPKEEGLRITVVDSVTGQSLPGAEVRQINPGRLNQGEDWIDLPFELGTEIAIADDASFTVARGPGTTMWFARLGNRHGAVMIPRDSSISELRLVVGPMHEVRVRVLDMHGRPAPDIPVALWMKGDRFRFPFTTRRTAQDDGMVILRWFDELPGFERYTPGVGLAFPGALDIRAAIDITNLRAVIDLRCPPVGSIRVKLSISGKPAADGTELRLSAKGNQPGQETRGDTLRGSHTFSPVGLGRTFDVAAPLARRWIRISAAGPTREGETLEVVINGRRVELQAQMIQSDGTALADTNVHVQVLPDNTNSAYQIRSNAKGQIKFAFAELAGSRYESFQLTLAAPWNETILTAIPVTEAPLIDLGEIHIPSTETLCRGTVVTDDGTPVSGAEVRPVRKNANWSTGWESAGQQVLTNAEGRFEISGSAHEEGLWLKATVEGLWRHEPVPMDTKHDVRLVLSPSTALKGQVLFHSGLSTEGIGAAIRDEARVGATPRGKEGLSTAIHSTGNFQFDALSNGIYTLTITLPNHDEVYRRAAIRVMGGVAELQPIDLRQRIGSLDIEARNELGRKIAADVYVLHGDRGVRQLGTSDQQLLFDASIDWRSVVIEAEGYFPVALGPVSGSHRVKLVKGIPVTLSVDHVSIPTSPCNLRVALKPGDDPSLRPGGRRAAQFRARWRPDSGSFDSNGRAVVHVPGPGRYRVSIVVDYSLNGFHDELDVSATEPFWINVVSSNDGVHVMSTDRAKIQTATKRIIERIR